MSDLLSGGRLLTTALLLTAATTCFAQAPTAPELPKGERPPSVQKNILKVAPLGIIMGSLPITVEKRIAYERVLGPRSSGMVSFSDFGTNYVLAFAGKAALDGYISTAFAAAGHPTFFWSDLTLRANGKRYQAQYRRYLSRKRASPEGWYLAPHYGFSSVDYTVSSKDFDLTVGLERRIHAFNLLFGHQRILGKHFVFDVFTGLGYQRNTYHYTTSRGEPLALDNERNYLKLSSGLNLGWAF